MIEKLTLIAILGSTVAVVALDATTLRLSRAIWMLFEVSIAMLGPH